MTFTDILIAAHVFFAIVIFGPLVVFGFIVPSWIRKGPEMAKPVAAMGKALDHIARGALIVFVFGLLIVAQSKAYSFSSDKWLGPAMGLFVVILLIGYLVIARTHNQATTKLEAGETAEAEATKLLVANVVEVVLLIAILWLMVRQP